MTTSAEPRFSIRNEPGLTTAEVAERLRIHGENVLQPPDRASWWSLYLEKFDDPVIRILLIAAVLAVAAGALDGHYAECIGIIVAILLATLLAFVNEHRAGKELAVVSRIDDDVSVAVVREQRVQSIARRSLVPGDVVLLHPGEEVPADGVLLEAIGLQVDEAHLTGESVAVAKECAVTAAVSESGFPSNRVFRGTIVVDGRGTMRIDATGDQTEIGRTARAAAEDSESESPLQLQLTRLSRMIGVVGTAVAALAFLALLVRAIVTRELVLTAPQWIFAASTGAGVAAATIRVWFPILLDALEFVGRPVSTPAWFEREGAAPWLQALATGLTIAGSAVAVLSTSARTAGSWWLPVAATSQLLSFFMVAVTIIVVAVPEGLAMSVTLSLAYSMRRMLAANTLVRRLYACETIGSATVICCDKTGTLTRNQMRVRDVILGRGDDAAGSEGVDSLLAEGIAVNSTAHLEGAGPERRPIGDPTEGALLLWLAEQSIDHVAIRDSLAIARQWGFSSRTKLMATAVGSLGAAGLTLHVKGAPELLLMRCSRVATRSGVESLGVHRETIQQRLLDAQARGFRTLGFAVRELVQDADAELEELCSGLTWIGFIAIADAVRMEVPSALELCRRAGIRVKIVTGDNALTAAEIARTAGLFVHGATEGVHTTGRDFASMPDDVAAQFADRLDILSRATPADKLKLVRTLRANGEIVAVTGDGVNDAPALNHAHVGLAMGASGTAIARQASDIVLLDDSFSSIVQAVLWGRGLYRNIQRFLVFQLTINVAALGTALLGPFIGIALPLTVTQMLWINLIMDTFAALALATEPPSPELMEQPPRPRAAFIITRPMARTIAGVGTLFLGILAAMLFAMQRDGVVDARELTVFFTVFVLLQFWNLFNARSIGQTRSALADLTSNKAFLTIVAAVFFGQVAIVQLGGAAFRTTPLSVREWMVLIAATSPVLLAGECLRWWQRRRSSALTDSASLPDGTRPANSLR